MNPLFFIINPEARNGYCHKIWLQIEQELLAKKIHYIAFSSEYSGHAKVLTESIVQKSQGEEIILVVVGGDGTLHEVLNGVINNHHVKIGFIPAGSGNDFSRGSNIPKDPIAALHMLLNRMKREPTFIDIGLINNENIYFVNSMGVGFDALISNEANASKLKRWLNRFSLGNLVYAFILLRRLFTYKCAHVQLTVDGQVHQFDSTWFVTIANQPYYGGGMKIAPQAVTNDGLLNIIVVQNISRLKLLAVFLSVFWGGHLAFKEVYSFTGREIKVQCSHPLPVHADGEPIGNTPVHISILPTELGIISRGVSDVQTKTEGSNNVIEK